MNPYYSPEKFGLTQIGEYERGGGYDFDTLVVWKDDAGRVLYAQDAGCSCPTPFEDVGMRDMTEVTAASWSDFVAALKEHGSKYRYAEDYDAENDAEITELLAKVSPLVPKADA